MAKRLGGKTTPASGAKELKGDVQVKGIARIECKTTQAKSFSVTRETLAKIEDAATSSGEVPALVVEFLNGAGRPVGSVAILPLWALDMLMDKLQTVHNMEV